MLFSLLYFLVCRLLGAGGRRSDEKDIERLVLRHQVRVLQRQVKRSRLSRLDRVLSAAAASRRLTKSSWSPFLVRPETLLRWRRELVRKKWTFRKTGSPAGRRSSPTSGPSSSAWAGRTPLGVPADPRGAPQVRDQDPCDNRPRAPAPPRPRPCSPPGRPNLDPVPALKGGGDRWAASATGAPWANVVDFPRSAKV
jgi:hypothetical protein